MRAAVCTRYGPPEVLELSEVPKPVPRSREVLIKVRATTVSSGDCRVRGMDLPRGFRAIGPLVLGFGRPRQPILGTDLAGEIEAIGAKVSKFKVGDQVLASSAGMGGYAEYKCVRESDMIAPKPAILGYGEAAALPFGGLTALCFFRKGKLRQGERLLVNGASGAVGTAAIQIAKAEGAEVTAVCSGANAELVKSLGAAHVIDYTREDFTKNGERYHVIMDNAGTAPFSRSRGSLEEGGRFLQVLATLPEIISGPWQSLTSGKKVVIATASREDLRRLVALAEAGKLQPVVDRRYPLEQIVEAHRYVDTHRKRGNVVITVG